MDSTIFDRENRNWIKSGGKPAFPTQSLSNSSFIKLFERLNAKKPWQRGSLEVRKAGLLRSFCAYQFRKHALMKAAVNQVKSSLAAFLSGSGGLLQYRITSVLEKIV